MREPGMPISFEKSSGDSAAASAAVEANREKQNLPERLVDQKVFGDSFLQNLEIMNRRGPAYDVLVAKYPDKDFVDEQVRIANQNAYKQYSRVEQALAFGAQKWFQPFRQMFIDYFADQPDVFEVAEEFFNFNERQIAKFKNDVLDYCGALVGIKDERILADKKFVSSLLAVQVL